MIIKGQLTSPEEFGAIVLHANPDGSAVRLRDVARIEVGGKSYQFTSRLNGQAAAAYRRAAVPDRQCDGKPRQSRRKMDELSLISRRAWNTHTL